MNKYKYFRLKQVILFLLVFSIGIENTWAAGAKGYRKNPMFVFSALSVFGLPPTSRTLPYEAYATISNCIGAI